MTYSKYWNKQKQNKTQTVKQKLFGKTILQNKGKIKDFPEKRKVNVWLAICPTSAKGSLKMK